MIRTMKVLFLCAACCLAAGCRTAGVNLASKNLSGNGAVIDTHLGINPDTGIPEIRTSFISGDFASVKAGGNNVTYREESAASIWNAQSVTRKRFLLISLNNNVSLLDAIRAISEVIEKDKK